MPLRFSHAYAFRGAYLVAGLDEVARALLTARHVGLVSRSESERELAEATRVVRRAFTSPTGYRFLGITRADYVDQILAPRIFRLGVRMSWK